MVSRGVPFQYINKSAYFYKSEFYVDERVLIPRSETEILVEKAVEEIKKLPQKEITLYEVGVGPGPIGLSVLQEVTDKKIRFIGTDISEDALNVFRINQFKLSYKIPRQHIIEIVKADRLKGLKEKADIILSNPPYIKKDADRELVHHQVLEYEPEVALFLDDEPYLDWFKEFFIQVESLINKNGYFIMEGHENHLAELESLGQQIFSGPPMIQKDYTNRNRFLCVPF